MRKRDSERGGWETPSLEWIHRVRHERQSERAGRPVRPLSHDESEQLAKRHGLRLAQKTPLNR